MELRNVDDENLNVYLHLVQCYEAEFSAITQKKPNGHGLFELDTKIGGRNVGIILYREDVPAGLAAIEDKGEEAYEVREFYIIPYFRKQSLGTRFAHDIWRSHPGCWEIKQIAGAEYATLFWRKAISRFTDDGYLEDVFHDPYWGMVTRQKFTWAG